MTEVVASEALLPARFPRAVLFDLDGTLLDSAPDFVATLNRMRHVRGLPSVPAEVVRPSVSRGSRAMLQAAFPEIDQAEREDWVPEFLSIYQDELGRHSQLFDGVAELLEALEAAGTVWGIVTNKPEYLAQLILPRLGWQGRCAVLLGGDTLPERKPHPMPLRIGCERMGVSVADCVYVGDDERDIIAARQAPMPSIAALWGYRMAEDDPVAWRADRMVEDVHALLTPANWPVAP